MLDFSIHLGVDMAEKEGFEPPKRLPVYRISSAAPSTARTFLRFCGAKVRVIISFAKIIRIRAPSKIHNGVLPPPPLWDDRAGVSCTSF